MAGSTEFVFGLLGAGHSACASWDDLSGPHARLLRHWQARGFLAREGGRHPTPSCPRCPDGSPYRVSGRHYCNRCGSAVDERRLRLWRFDREALLGELAAAWRLHGGVRPVEAGLWQLGSTRFGELLGECFFRLAGPVPDRAVERLAAFRHALVISALPQTIPQLPRLPRVSLLELVHWDGRRLMIRPLPTPGGARAVRFEPTTGVLWVGDRPAGELPLHSKEYYLVACLAERLDEYVPYADLKHYVLARAGVYDAADEATFCQRLKSRIKALRITGIDGLITTTNKADGYRLRGWAGEP